MARFLLELGRSMHATALITHALRRRRLVVDRVFDEIFPFELRRASSVHWTPVETAVRAAMLLAPLGGETILDIGAGVGKFCLVAAAATRAKVRGIEHRARLVDAAREAARTLSLDVEFVHGTVADVEPGSFDSVYLFNPFAENLCERGDWLDDTVELGEARFVRDVGRVEELLRASRRGTRVVTYCGFGGCMPEEYRALIRDDHAGRFELWVKTR